MSEDLENNFFAGIAYHHFNRNAKRSFYSNGVNQMTPRWVYSAKAKMFAMDNNYITILADYTRQGPYSEIIAGAMISYQLDDVENPRDYLHGGGFM